MNAIDISPQEREKHGKSVVTIIYHVSIRVYNLIHTESWNPKFLAFAPIGSPV